MLTFGEISGSCATWLVYSGTIYHIFNNRALFAYIQNRKKPIDISAGDGSVLGAAYDGIVDLVLNTDCWEFRTALGIVLYMPTASGDLTSVSQAVERSFGTKFEGNDCTMYKVGRNTVTLKLKRVRCSYKALRKPLNLKKAEANVVKTSKETQKYTVLTVKKCPPGNSSGISIPIMWGYPIVS